MMFFKGKNIPEFIEEKREVRQKKKSTLLKDLIDGSLLTRQWFADQAWYLVFCFFLAIIYIGNRHNAEKIYRETLKLQEEVKELRFEKIINASDLMGISRQSQVLKMLKKEDLDLVESTTAPKKIIVEK